MGVFLEPLDVAVLAGERGRAWGGVGVEPFGSAMAAGTVFIEGWLAGGDWLRIDGLAARTVSIAVAMAVCIGILGMAVTVAATMEAIYLEYSFEWSQKG